MGAAPCMTGHRMAWIVAKAKMQATRIEEDAVLGMMARAKTARHGNLLMQPVLRCVPSHANACVA